MATAQVDNQADNLSELFANVVDVLTDESPLMKGLEGRFESIIPGLRAFQALLKASESHMIPNNDQVTALLIKIKEISLFIKTHIESFVMKREKRMKKGSGFNKYILNLGDVKARAKLTKVMKAMQVQIQDILDTVDQVAEAETSTSTSSSEVLQPSLGDDCVIGHEDDMWRLLGHLRSGGVAPLFDDLDSKSDDHRSSAPADSTQMLVRSLGRYLGVGISARPHEFQQQVRLSAVSIVGVEGVGKTALASRIYKNTDIARIFSSRAWVTVPRDFQPEELLSRVAKQVAVGSDEPEKSWSFAMLRETIQFSLAERSYLIVLDDVWTPQAWRLLQQVLPTTDRSRVIITTRVGEVAMEASSGSGYIHLLQKLTPQKSWQLFCTKLEDTIDNDLVPLAREILESCGGIPLRILETVGILSWEAKTVERWTLLLTELKQKGSLNHMVADSLPLHLRKCLYYFLLFDNNFEIPARRLIAMWIAEGLVLPNLLVDDEEKPLEAIAEQYLCLLQSHFAIELKRKSNGDIKTCRLRNSIRSILISKASANKFFYERINKKHIIRRLAHHPTKQYNDDSHGPNVFEGNYKPNSSSPYCFRYLRTFASFDPREGPEPGNHIKNFLHISIKMSGCKWLRVLDLEGVFRPILPKALLKELSQLRYLSLRRTYVDVLPASVGLLRKLQTLDLKHTSISLIPISIWKLEDLRHLYLSESYRTRLPSPSLAVSLNNLQTLSGGFVEDETSVRNGLDGLKNLRKLALTCQMSVGKQKELGEWLVKLTGLETLKLRSINEMVEPSQFYLENLLSLTKLNSLYLLGVILNRNIMMSLSQSLTDVTLSSSKLEQDPMPVFGKLPNLRSLSLLSDSYTGNTMTCPVSSFPELRLLRLWKLNDLEHWNAHEGAMPVIKTIEIRCCKKLKLIPKRMHYLTSIQ